MGLFTDLCTNETLEIGWHNAHMDSRSDFITDSHGYIDYTYNRDKRLRFIIDQLKRQRYRPRRTRTIDVPKSNLAVRPGEMLHIEDSTVLHGALYLLAPQIDKHLGEEVYSYRLASDYIKRAKRAKTVFNFTRSENVPFLKNSTLQKIGRTDPWFYSWLEFDDESAKAIVDKNYTHLTITDISAYFENIDLMVLEDILNKHLPNEADFCSTILGILNNYSRRTADDRSTGRGIPQGNEVSSFIGNIYLIPLDEQLRNFCSKHDAIWFRYMDDIKLFSKSYDVAREGVFLINQELRKLSLNIQGAKTRILWDKQLHDEIYDEDMDRINNAHEYIREHVKNNDKQSTKDELAKVNDIVQRFTLGGANAVSGLSGKENRLFRRCLSLYGSCFHSRMTKPAMHALEQLPDKRVLDSALRYLLKLPYRRHDDILNELLSLLESNKMPFPYQQATVLEAVKKLHPQNAQGVASRIRAIGFGSKNTHWAIQQKAAEALFCYPYSKVNLSRVFNLCQESTETPVKRAGMLLMTRLDVQQVRTHIHEHLSNPDPDLSRIATYWNACLQSREYAEKRLKSINKSFIDDIRIMQNLPNLYAIRCHGNLPIVREVRSIATTRLKKSKSHRIKWHCNEILKLTEFTVKA